MESAAPLSTRTGHLDLVRSVALAANAALVIDDVLDVALDAVCAYLGWPVGTVWVADGELWSPAFWYAEDERLLARFRVRTGAITPSDGVLGAMLSTGAPASIWALDDVSEPGAAVALEAGLTTSLAFAVRVGDEPVAVIQGFAAADHQPDRSVLAAMETICVQVGRVIERDRSARRLMRSEADFAAAQQLSRVGSWSWDVVEDEIRWSAQMYANFEVEAEGFDGSYREFLELVHPDDREGLSRAVSHALREGAPFTFEHRTATVPVRWIRCRAAVDHDERGEVRRLWGTAQDVTDIAVRLAGARPGGVIGEFGPERRERALQELLLREDLRHAVGRDELVVEYQPVVRLVDGRLVGLEALVRWQRPSGELLGPDVIVPIAEEIGIMDDLGTWVLHTACRQLSGWQDVAPATLSMAINVAPDQLRAPGFVAAVGVSLRSCSLSPRALVLEITESALLGETPEIADAIAALRGLGVRVIIDDFGTGFSSLSRLRELPLDGLKIDRSFLVPITSIRDDPPMLRALFTIAGHLDLHVIAEGVETPAQLAALLRHGCDEAQGFLFSRPLSAEQVRKLLADPADGPEW